MLKFVFAWGFQMTNELVRKGLLRGLAGLVLLGSMSLGGCISGAAQRYNSGMTTPAQYSQEKAAEDRYNNSLGISLLGGLIGARGVQIGNPGAVVFGNALANHGAAQASAPNIVVNNSPPNVYVPNQSPAYAVPQSPVISPPNVTLVGVPNEEPLVLRKEFPELGMVTMIVSNYCKDFNGNGVLDYSEDYGGMKRTYSRLTENITLSVSSSKLSPNFGIELLDGSGNKIDYFEGKGKHLFKEYLPGNNKLLSEGTYSGAFYADKEFLGKLEFKVLNKKWEVVQK